MRARGQALVELAVSLPVLLILAFGCAQFVRLALARAGLDAATAAAAAAAARAPSAGEAQSSGSGAFRGVAAAYGLDPSTTVVIEAGDFSRGGTVTARAASEFTLGFSGVPALGAGWRLESAASARIEDWRSRSAVP